MQSLSTAKYTFKEVHDILHGVYGARVVGFRYALLDFSDNYICDLQTVKSCSIAHHSKSSIKNTARLKLVDDGSINWSKTKLQPFIRLRMPNEVIQVKNTWERYIGVRWNEL